MHLGKIFSSYYSEQNFYFYIDHYAKETLDIPTPILKPYHHHHAMICLMISPEQISRLPITCQWWSLQKSVLWPSFISSSPFPSSSHILNYLFYSISFQVLKFIYSSLSPKCCSNLFSEASFHVFGLSLMRITLESLLFSSTFLIVVPYVVMGKCPPTIQQRTDPHINSFKQVESFISSVTAINITQTLVFGH